jgi:predicted benzoate:H+ symporter BenE
MTIVGQIPDHHVIIVMITVANILREIGIRTIVVRTTELLVDTTIVDRDLSSVTTEIIAIPEIIVVTAQIVHHVIVIIIADHECQRTAIIVTTGTFVIIAATVPIIRCQ